MAPLLRAQQIKSLMRLAELLAVRAEAGEASSYSHLNEETQRATEQAIAGAVAELIELGIKPITEGEYESDKFYSGFFEGLLAMQIVKDILLPTVFKQVSQH
jgi:methionine synthase II (cobalamin-independent)